MSMETRAPLTDTQALPALSNAEIADRLASSPWRNPTFFLA
jgi:hypothetical protein